MPHLQSVCHVVEAVLQLLHGSVRHALVAVFDHRPAQVILERQLHEVVRLELRPRCVLSTRTTTKWKRFGGGLLGIFIFGTITTLHETNDIIQGHHLRR